MRQPGEGFGGEMCADMGLFHHSPFRFFELNLQAEIKKPVKKSRKLIS